ncbi:hypothetical protein VTN77DRAFT_3751 [Rasamsonia byssochlamydoides]|uniref:uncharacterized protein n=1 Tax=Rasamsonia byssochlamydoides TaxID=89139 RepID=UPI003742A580
MSAWDEGLTRETVNGPRKRTRGRENERNERRKMEEEEGITGSALHTITVPDTDGSLGVSGGGNRKGAEFLADDGRREASGVDKVEVEAGLVDNSKAKSLPDRDKLRRPFGEQPLTCPGPARCPRLPALACA